ncbi:MAG: KR domain-containing protein [Flavobacteriaceae bacterium]|nr:KR domain-containing protein [Flavobacteriaceae bacterium]
MPITRYSIEHMKDAFTCLSKSNHIGKIVLDIDETFYPETCLFPTTIFDHKKYYLITGGFGGLGMKLTEWMISYGARNFILTTRNYNEHNKQTIDHLIDKMKDDNKETNIVIFNVVDELSKDKFVNDMLLKHIKISDMGQGKLRMVTHLDYSDAMHEIVLEAINNYQF